MINLAREGVPVSKVLAFILSTQEKIIRRNSGLAKIFINPQTNKTYVENDKIKQPDLANTLETISEDPFSFYNGTLAEKIVEENNANGYLKLCIENSFKKIHLFHTRWNIYIRWLEELSSKI